MKKTYISKTGAKLTFPVRFEADGRVQFVSLNGVRGDLTTEKEALQDAIEASRKFKSGEVFLLNGEPNKKKTSVKDAPKEVESHPENNPVVPPVVEVTTTEVTPPVDEVKIETGETQNANDPGANSGEVTGFKYPGVTDMQTAASILRKNHDASHQSVRLPAQIIKKAKELNVSFPDLVQ